MGHQFFGWLSAILVFGSVLPYAYRTWQGVVEPNITTWGLWSVIGLSLVLTYDSSGAGANLIPVIMMPLNPIVIVSLAIYRKKGHFEPFTKTEYACAALCITALGGWFFVRESQYLSQFALYLSLAADACAIIPTFFWILKNPERDRPAMWLMFSSGYLFALLAINEHTIANYALPLYMSGITAAVAWVLIQYRLKKKIHIREWI